MLQAEHRERGDGDGERDHDAGRDGELLALEEEVRQREAQPREEAAQHEHGPAREAVPCEGDEEAHRADREQPADVVQDVGRAEAGRVVARVLQEAPQGVGLLAGEHAGTHRVVEPVALEVHRLSPRGAAGSG